MNFHSDCAVNEIEDLPVREKSDTWLLEGIRTYVLSFVLLRGLAFPIGIST